MGTRLQRAGGAITLAALATAIVGTNGPLAAAPVQAAGGIPQAPFIQAVVPRGLSALLSWAPNPSVDAVTSYTATAAAVSTPVPAGCGSPPTSTAPGTDSSMVVSSLCAAVAYSITLTALNATGAGPPSPASNPVVPLPAQAPSAPIIVSVLGRDTSLLVSWSAPDDSGGSPITGYVLNAAAGTQSLTINSSPSNSQATMTGLTNGVQYSLTLQAANVIGTSVAAQGSGTPRTAYAPSAPQDFSASPTGSGGVAAKWSPPIDDGGDAITGYVVTYQQVVPDNTGTGWVPAPGSTPTIVPVGGAATRVGVSSLSPSNAYFTFSVAAVTAVATGQAAQLASPVTPTIRLAPGAVVLTPSTSNALASDVGGKLTWAAPAPSQVSSLHVGDVVVSGPAPAVPDGLLAKVKTIAQLAGGAYVVGTMHASLSDAFVDASLAQSGNPLANGGVFRATSPGVRSLRLIKGVSFSTTITLSVNIEQTLGTSGSITVTGSVDITPTVTLDLTIQQGFLGIPDGATLSASGVVESEGQLTFGLSGQQQLQIGEIDGTPVVAPAGPVPVVVVPIVKIYLEVSGELHLGVSWSQKVGLAMNWSSSNPGSLQTSSLNEPIHLTPAPVPGVSTGGSASIGLKFAPQAAIYDLTGPEISAEALLVATVNFNPTPDKPFISIAPSVQISASWDVHILVFNGDVSVTLATVPFPLLVVSAVPAAWLNVKPADAVVAPGHQVTFNTSRNDGFIYPVTWSLQGAVQNDSVSSGGVLTAAAPSGRSLTVVATDSTGLVAETTVTVAVAAFDPPQNLKVAAYPVTGRAALSWAAPSHTGGSALASYIVVTRPGAGVQVVGPTVTSTSITGLSLDTSYVFYVYATNATGLQSDPATAFVHIQGPIASIQPSPNGGKGSNGLYGVSCVSTGFCAAVGSDIYTGDPNNVPQTLAEVWDGTSWSLAPSPNSGSGYNALSGVSCVTASFCIAVGTAEPSSFVGQTLIEAWNGSSWAVVPSPNNGTSTSTNSLNGVSCVSATSCTAVGDSNGGVGATLVETWNGTSWSIVSSPNAGTGGNLLQSVSCVSAGSCFAVGYSSGGGAQSTLVEAWNGTTWSIVPSPNNGTSPNFLNGVSCASPSFCTAVGKYQNGNVYDTLIESWDGNTWSILSSANAGIGSNELQSVYCLTANFCTAAGDYVNNSGFPQTLVEVWNGTDWSIATTPNVTNASQLSAVHCVTGSYCFAVGFGNPSSTLVEAWNGTGWSIVPSPNAGTGSNTFDGVSCVSVTFCMAVGAYENFNASVRTLVEVWNGTSWSIVASPNNGGGDNRLLGVSCLTANWCMALGYTIQNGSASTLAEAWNGSSWSIVPSPNSGTAGSELIAVSCLLATFCMATGYAGGATLAEAWNGSSWSIVPSPNAGIVNNELDGVSCVSPNSCIAVGSDFSSNTSQVTLVEAWNGSTWSILPTPNVNTYRNRLNSVSCPSTRSCIAVGDFLVPNTGFAQTLVEAWDGSAWSVMPSPNVAGRFQVQGYQTINYLTGVSCSYSYAAFCIAVGTFSGGDGNSQTLVETWNGSDWSILPSPNADLGNPPPPNYAVNPGSYLNGVSCASISSCAAVGAFINIGTNWRDSIVQTLIETIGVVPATLALPPARGVPVNPAPPTPAPPPRGLPVNPASPAAPPPRLSYGRNSLAAPRRSHSGTAASGPRARFL